MKIFCSLFAKQHLGLYIAKKIVQFHKGDIWASNWADGVRFQLLLRREDRMAGRR